MAKGIDEFAAAAALSVTDEFGVAQGDALMKRSTLAALITFLGANVVDSVFGAYAANADLTTVIPIDDTIPQIGEGTEIISVAITPKSATNKLRVTFTGSGAANSTQLISAALFLNGGANAIAATTVRPPGADYQTYFGLTHEFVPGATTAQTLSLRVGPQSGTMRMNGNSTSRRFGGVMQSTLVVSEIRA